MEKVSWTDHVRNEEVLLSVKEQKDNLHDIYMYMYGYVWIGHFVSRNYLLKQVIEGTIKGGIEVTGRRVRRGGKLLDDLTHI
jgi:hypothetical protein